MIATMSKGQLIRETMRLITADHKKKEVGVVGFVLRLKASFAEQKAYQEIQAIKEIYYDPFEKNPENIKKVIKTNNNNTRK